MKIYFIIPVLVEIMEVVEGATLVEGVIVEEDKTKNRSSQA